MDRPWLRHYDTKVPHTLTYPDVPLFHLLEDTARTHPRNTATIFFGAKLTYEQINAQADRLAEIHRVNRNRDDLALGMTHTG